MKRITSYIIFTLATIPALAGAAFNLAPSTTSTITDIFGYARDILALVEPILFALAFVVFFWGLSKFILSSSGNAADLKKGKDYMMWSILALFILVTFRAIVALLTNEFDFGNGKTKPILPESATIIQMHSRGVSSINNV